MRRSVKLRRRNYLFVWLFGARWACVQIEIRKNHSPVNHEPIAADQSIETDEDTSTVITLTGTDPDRDPLSFHVVTDPGKGALSGTPPDLTYTPDADYNGADSFTFKVNDGKRDSSNATVTILVHPLNDSPDGQPQSIEMDEDSSVSITLEGSDVDGDDVTYTVVSQTEHGLLDGMAPDLTYTPDPDYNGPDSFTFKVNDGTVDSSPSEVSIKVLPVNDAPVAHASSDRDFYYVGDDVILDGSTSQDVDGDVLTYHWAFRSCPMDPVPELSDASKANPSFVPYAPGLYKMELTVHDGAMDSAEPALVALVVTFAPFAATENSLSPSDGVAGDHFGASVSIRANRALVGAPQTGTASGTAYLFERNSRWTEAATLKPLDGEGGNRFGSALSLTDDCAITGAPGDDDHTGSAYVYRKESLSWLQEQKLTAGAEGACGDEFGASVSIQKNLAAVGAPGDDLGEEAWFSYFGKEEYDPKPGLMMWWSESTQRWESYDGRVGLLPTGRLGFRPIAMRLIHTSSAPITHVAVLDQHGLILGECTGYASGDPIPLNAGSDIGEIQAWTTFAVTNIEFLPEGAGDRDVDAGSAYVFRYDGATWAQEVQLTAGDGEAGDHFGASMSLSNNTLIVGAHLDDDDRFTDSGSAYVFINQGTAWVEQAKLVAADGGEHHQFGAAVSLDGDSAVVGAPGTGDETGGGHAGAVYVFLREDETWVQECKLTASNSMGGDCFGASVSLNGDYLVVGAPNAENPDGVASGAAYVFKRDGFFWTEEGKVTAGDGQAGQRFGTSVAMSGDQVIAGAPWGDHNPGDEAGGAYVYTIESYHTVTLTAEPEEIFEGESSLLYWTAVNALTAEIEPDLGMTDVPVMGSAEVSPEETTIYTITTIGRYGMDTAFATITVADD
jgi:hypothetical protein